MKRKGSTPITAVAEILERRSEAFELWNRFNRWLQAHPAPRWTFRGQSQSWSLKPAIGRLGRYDAGREFQLLNTFKRASVPMVTLPNLTSNWDWLAIAQHHGLPTRLMDWTSNPLAAAFFATGSGADTKKAGVIYAADASKFHFYRPDDPSELDPFEIDQVGMFYPAAVAPRIVAQRGLFSVHPQPARALVLRSDHDNFLLPGHLKDEFRRILFSLGVDEAQLMADLDCLAKSLKWRYESRIPLE